MDLKQRSALSACIASLLAGGVLLPQQAGAVDAAELTKQLNNPIAALVSVPIKLDWNTGAGKEDADRYTYVVQPVIPFSLNDNVNAISRTIVPVYIDAESIGPHFRVYDISRLRKRSLYPGLELDGDL